MSREVQPRQIIFDPTSEIFATDSGGGFFFPLTYTGDGWIETADYDEVRFTFSMWNPASGAYLDLDRCYAELRGTLDREEEHWVKMSEIEPVVPPYGAGDSFDGWLVLPIFGEVCAYGLAGGGFDARTRLQIRATAYLVP